MLKAVHLPALAANLREEAAAFAATWIGHFPFSLQGELEGRAAALLPCLMLARVDGKSPVEYLDAAGRQRVQEIATPLIRHRPRRLADVFDSLLRS